MTPSPHILTPHVSLPATVRDNDYYRQHYPELVSDAENSVLSTVWTPNPTQGLTHFEQAMTPYLTDPFRGTIHRHVLAPGETIRSHEIAAATEALTDADIEPAQVDLLISVSMWPDQLGFGNGLWLAEALGLRCGAWNLETAQSGGLAALQAAHAFVASGLHQTVLVIASCSYSRAVPESSTFSWFLGDAAAATIVTATANDRPSGEMLSAATVHTTESQHEFIATPLETPEGPNLALTPSTARGSAMRKHTDQHIATVTHQAIGRAGMHLEDIDFFVFSTPTAWFTDFTTTLLGIDPTKTINTYPRYGNIGPALPLVNLHDAIANHHVHDNDLILIASIGSVSSAATSILRWHTPNTR